MKVKILRSDKEGYITLSEQALNALLQEAYNEGYTDGSSKSTSYPNIIYNKETPTWDWSKITCDTKTVPSINLYTTEDAQSTSNAAPKLGSTSVNGTVTATNCTSDSAAQVTGFSYTNDNGNATLRVLTDKECNDLLKTPTLSDLVNKLIK